MRNYISSSFILIIILFITFFSWNNNRYVLKRLVIDKHAFTYITKFKDFRYLLDLTSKRKKTTYPTYNLNLSKKKYIQIQNELNSKMEDYVLTGKQAMSSEKSYSVTLQNDNGISNKSKLKLFGMNPDHFRDPTGHSFRLKHNGFKDFGKSKMNYLKPSTRNYGIDFLANIIYSNMSNGIKINSKPIRIFFNNIDFGFYYQEQFFDKYLIELNGFRDSEIIEIYADSIKVNHLPKELEFSRFERGNTKSKNELVNLIDLGKTFDLIAISVIGGNNHPLLDMNLHWYYNPTINKLQPILREIGAENIQTQELNDISEIDKNLVENLVIQLISKNFILNKLYEKNKYFFLKGVSNSLRKLNFYFNENQILNSPEILSFLEFNPTNEKFMDLFLILSNNYSKIYRSLPKEEIVELKKDTLSFKNNFTFSSDISFENKVIYFDEGISLRLRNNALVFFENCDVTIGGVNVESKIGGNKLSSGSFFFKNSNVNIINVDFSHLKNPEGKSISTPSSITFYETKVSIRNSIFKENIKGDDFLNFYRCSDVVVNNSNFKNIFSDAIDSDFSKIKINNSRFEYVGNDGIDLSGSESLIHDNYFKSIGDKCISVGENSNSKIEKNKFNFSEIAIVAKDGSKIKTNNNEFKNNKLDLVFFIKKPIYGSPVAEEIFEPKNTRIFYDSKTKIGLEKLDNYELNKVKNLESILYGRKFGKSTK